MATTITPGTLTVIHSESISLNGTQMGATNTQTIASVTEVSKRIVTVPVSKIVLTSFSTAVSNGTFIEGDVRYIRLTNKDDTNFVYLVFKNEFNNEISIKLDAGQSFIYNADNSAGVVDTIGGNQLALSFTDATCDYNNDPTITCDASKQIIPGLRVAGTGIPAGATVISVNVAGAVTSFELSASTTGGAVTNGSLVFGSGFGDLVEITAEADTATVDVEVFVASV